ncbi:L,D-transpeptidase [Dermatobacter hominis]|uniref:L,D-transpeptidase n=1 Tax=Dermatobacter hominis TaxID=2884263 RepID=UPI001D127B2A|nr:L,D-transpeptidase [Dermatobacter hominis]UDY37066.1 L,D-transpeptidase [Dermatobacter hominis]
MTDDGPGSDADLPNPGGDTPGGGERPWYEPDGQDAAERPDRRMSRGRIALLVGLIVVAIVAVVIALAGSGDDPAPDGPSTTASSASTTAERWPATQARIATAKNPSIIVHSEPPTDWDEMEPVSVSDSPDLPQSQDAMSPRDALPRPDYPIQGRYVDPAGWSFNNPTAWGDPFVMLVTEQRGDWLKVEIPVRPNGTDGYVNVEDVSLSDTGFRLDLRLGTRTLTLYDGNDVVLSTQVVIGKSETQTPTGRFYITDLVEQTDPAGFYGPLALATNAYSEQIDVFENGVPVIALHGTNRPELIGQDVSNGCIRVPNEQILKIADQIPMGTPIDITA